MKYPTEIIKKQQNILYDLIIKILLLELNFIFSFNILSNEKRILLILLILKRENQEKVLIKHFS